MYLIAFISCSCSLLIGLGILGAQISKQKSIEYQKQMEINEEKNKRTSELLKEAKRQENIDNCLKSAYNTYSNNWDNLCKKLYLEDSCGLPQYRADDLEADRKYNEKNCYERYK